MWRNGQGRHCINVGTWNPKQGPLKYVKGQIGAIEANSYDWSV